MEIIKVSTGLAWDQQGQFGVAFNEFSQYGVSHRNQRCQCSGVRCQDYEPDEIETIRSTFCYLFPDTRLRGRCRDGAAKARNLTLKPNLIESKSYRSLNGQNPLGKELL
jgi:hypothetical protein